MDKRMKLKTIWNIKFPRGRNGELDNSQGIILSF